MAQLSYGCRNKGKLQFKSDRDFFIILGILSNNRYVREVWGLNITQGVWGDEERIEILVDNQYLRTILGGSYTKGRPKYTPPILHRINCNNYIKYLNQSFSIQNGISQNGQNIRSIVQQNHAKFLNDFDTGYNS